MPGIDGHALATRLRRRFPALAVLYMSGYAGNVLAGAMTGGEHEDYLPKPFTPRQLADKVNRLLDAPPES